MLISKVQVLEKHFVPKDVWIFRGYQPLICILLLSWSSQKQVLVCLYLWWYDLVARLTGTLFLLWQVEMAFMKKVYWDELQNAGDHGSKQWFLLVTPTCLTTDKMSSSITVIFLFLSQMTTMILNCPTIHHKSHPSKWEPSLIKETMDRGQNMASAQKVYEQVCRFTRADIIKIETLMLKMSLT